MTGPLHILLGTSDSELSTRDIARQLHISQVTVVRRIQKARQRFERSRRREVMRDIMYTLLTLSAVMAAVSLVIIAAR